MTSDSRELAVQAGDDLSDGLGSTGGGGDDVVVDGTTTTPVLVGRTIDGLLGSGGCVDGGHQALNDAEFVIDNLGERCETVCSAGRVRDLHVTDMTSLSQYQYEDVTYDGIL